MARIAETTEQEDVDSLDLGEEYYERSAEQFADGQIDEDELEHRIERLLDVGVNPAEIEVGGESDASGGAIVDGFVDTLSAAMSDVFFQLRQFGQIALFLFTVLVIPGLAVLWLPSGLTIFVATLWGIIAGALNVWYLSS